MGLHAAIHDLLITTALEVPSKFLEASYTGDPPLLVAGSALVPSSVEANEVQSVFGTDQRYGRDVKQIRTSWTWHLKLRFDREVILDGFEEALMADPLVIAHDPAGGIDRQITLLLENSDIKHPPRGGASNGTEATYRFVAMQTPQ